MNFCGASGTAALKEQSYVKQIYKGKDLKKRNWCDAADLEHQFPFLKLNFSVGAFTNPIESEGRNHKPAGKRENLMALLA